MLVKLRGRHTEGWYFRGTELGTFFCGTKNHNLAHFFQRNLGGFLLILHQFFCQFTSLLASISPIFFKASWTYRKPLHKTRTNWPSSESAPKRMRRGVSIFTTFKKMRDTFEKNLWQFETQISTLCRRNYFLKKKKNSVPPRYHPSLCQPRFFVTQVVGFCKVPNSMLASQFALKFHQQAQLNELSRFRPSMSLKTC